MSPDYAAGHDKVEGKYFIFSIFITDVILLIAQHAELDLGAAVVLS
jgi:hypothetical protein